MKAGPKAAVDDSALPFRPRSSGAARFAAFCEKFIRVPKGTDALSPLRLRPWQLELVGSVLDAETQPRTAGWMLPRGQGKSSLVAALGLYELFCGGEGAVVCVVAVDERQAGIVFGIARRMVELDEELVSRCQVFKERLVIPDRDAQMHCLPAEPKRLEGLDYSLAILDEAGVANRDSYEVLTLAQGKRERSSLICIGTPGPDPNNQVLADLRNYAAEHPDDTSLVWREFAAAGFEDHPVDCQHCWELANPALDDFLHRDAMHALLPPKTREATFRRARLCQFATDTDGAFLPALQALEAEKLPIVEFPHSPARLTAATTDLYSAAVNGRITHSGDPTLAAHVAAAVIIEDPRGIRLSKASRSRAAKKIDLAACLVMAHSRATWRATHKKRKRARSFR